jgi:hypothetical protein
MATKKIKRFQEGGVSDKDRGLEASKEDKVGFFERLRMGNIDDEGSEAYRRFGAGRGKAERTPVETMAATPVTRPTAAAPEMDAMEEANTRVDRMLVPNQSVAEQPKPGGKPRVNVQAAKPSAPAKSSPKMQEQTYRRTSGDTGKREPAYTRKGGATADELANYKPPAKKQSLESQIPGGSSTGPVSGKKVEPMSDTERNIQNMLAVTGVGAGAAGALYKGKKILDARKAAKEGAKKRANLKRDVEEGIERNLADEFQNYSPSAAKKAIAAKQRLAKTKAERSRDLSAGQAKTKFTSASKTPSKKTKKFDDSESNVEFKRGGSVSSASRRADGIATQGKTRCKMR